MQFSAQVVLSNSMLYPRTEDILWSQDVTQDKYHELLTVLQTSYQEESAPYREPPVRDRSCCRRMTAALAKVAFNIVSPPLRYLGFLPAARVLPPQTETIRLFNELHRLGAPAHLLQVDRGFIGFQKETRQDTENSFNDNKETRNYSL